MTLSSHNLIYIYEYFQNKFVWLTISNKIFVSRAERMYVVAIFLQNMKLSIVFAVCFAQFVPSNKLIFINFLQYLFIQNIYIKLKLIFKQRSLALTAATRKSWNLCEIKTSNTI